MKFRKIAILGAGLLGASFAFAAKGRGLCERVSAWSRSASTREKCSRLPGIFDAVHAEPAEAAEGADLAVLCAPVENIPELAAKIAPALKAGSLVTDVGSVKGSICRLCSESVGAAGARFVGSHPMAGSEKAGMDFADENLFDLRPCFVTPLPDSDEGAVAAVSEAWRALGMKVYSVSPEEHDAIVARVSHLPHLAAALVCGAAADFDINLLPYSGQGFRDTTRVASGSPRIWESIVADNRGEILSALGDFSSRLGAMIAAIKSGDRAGVSSALEKAKAFRDKL